MRHTVLLGRLILVGCDAAHCDANDIVIASTTERSVDAPESIIACSTSAWYCFIGSRVARNDWMQAPTCTVTGSVSGHRQPSRAKTSEARYRFSEWRWVGQWWRWSIRRERTAGGSTVRYVTASWEELFWLGLGDLSPCCCGRLSADRCFVAGRHSSLPRHHARLDSLAAIHITPLHLQMCVSCYLQAVGHPTVEVWKCEHGFMTGYWDAAR